MSSLLKKDEGVFNPSLRFAFTNITEEDFVSAWDGSPIRVKPGQTIELNHHLANKLTDELVDKIMIGNAKLDEVAKNQPYYRSPQGPSLGVPAARKVWEDQIVRPLAIDEESPQLQVLRAQIKADLLADIERGKEPTPTAINIPTSASEFADLTNRGPVTEKEPLKVTTLS